MTVPADDEFLRVAAQALHGAGAGGDAALDALGWWQLLDDLGAPESRAAVFAVFRAQGRELASSCALGALMAQPYLALLVPARMAVVAAVPRESPRGGAVAVVVGDPVGRLLLVDRPGSGAWVLAPGDVELRPIEVPGQIALYQVGASLPGPPTIAEPDAARVRDRSAFLGRVAIALEILGAAEAALALAVEHAQAREQFGQPIATFQAVRHLLAWATTECTAVEAVTAEAVVLDDAAPPRYGDIAKAIAGRNGRRVCERALQVLGAIGFTAEHAHHHFHSRALALDSLLGTSAALTHELGVWRRSQPSDHGLPTAMLAAR